MFYVVEARDVGVADKCQLSISDSETDSLSSLAYIDESMEASEGETAGSSQDVFSPLQYLLQGFTLSVHAH